MLDSIIISIEATSGKIDGFLLADPQNVSQISGRVGESKELSDMISQINESKMLDLINAYLFEYAGDRCVYMLEMHHKRILRSYRECGIEPHSSLLKNAILE